MLNPCDCQRGPCTKPTATPVVLGGDLPHGHWSACPHGELRNPMLSAAVTLDAYASISPLAGWPDTYSAGVVDCLVALRMERAAEQRRQAEEATA